MKRLRESTDKSPALNASTVVNNDTKQQVEIGSSGPSRADNLRNNIQYCFSLLEIKGLLIERIMETPDPYSIFLNLKGVNKWFKKVIDDHFVTIINDSYTPHLYPVSGFNLLEPFYFDAAAPCLRAVQTELAVNCQFSGNKPLFKIEVNNFSFFYTFNCISNLRKALILYFEAKSNPDNTACKAYLESFETHIAFFKSLGQDNNFQFDPTNTYNNQMDIPLPHNFSYYGKLIHFYRTWLFIPFYGVEPSKGLLLNLKSPCSAYLFAHFLNACVLSSYIFQYIKLSYSEGEATLGPSRTSIILSFFKKYKDYELVSNTITHFIKEAFIGLRHYDTQIVVNSLKYLDEFIQLGLTDKSFAEKHLFEAATQILSNHSFHIQENALILINSLLKEGLFEKTFIENPLFQDKLEEILNSSSIKGQGFAALILLFLTNNSGSALTSPLKDLIGKIFEAWQDLPETLFQQLTSYTSIKDSLKNAIFEYITQIVASDQFDHKFYGGDGILFELAQNGLIEKSCLQLVINRELTDWLSDADHFQRGYNFFEDFTGILFIEQSWIVDLNLIPKLLLAQHNLGPSVGCLFDLMGSWIVQFPEITQCFLEQILEFFYSKKDSYVVGKQLEMLRLIIEKELIDQNSLREFKLIEKLSTGITSYPEQKIEYPYGGPLADESLILLFKTLTELDLLTQSTLLEFQIIKKLFFQMNFNHSTDSIDSLSCSIKEFFNTLINKSLITKSELIAEGLSYLSLTDTDIPDTQKRIIQSNVIAFVEFFFPNIDKSLVEEHQLIAKLVELLPLFDHDSKEGKIIYLLLSELSKLN